MARVRSEDQIFFIYNHEALTCEEDDLKDAIVYFFPSSLSVSSQCALVGQLMGMVDFFKSFAGSPPIIFTLQNNKMAIKDLGKYTMALAGNRREPDSVVLTQLEYLYRLFVFYQTSLHRLEQVSCGNSSRMSRIMQEIWDCYLPFVRRYGDNVAAAFESLPVVDLPEPRSMLLMKASHFLLGCQKQTSVLGGCILYRNRVLCSQFHPEITARLLIIQPQQSHFPCQHIKTDFKPPASVRMLSVYISLSEYKSIQKEQSQPAPSDPKLQQTSHNTPQKTSQQHSRSPARTEHKDKSKQRDLTHSRRFGSVDWNNTVKEFKNLIKDSAGLTTIIHKSDENCLNDESLSQNTQFSPSEMKSTLHSNNKDTLSTPSTSPLHKSSSQPDISNEDNVSKPRANTVHGQTSYSRQLSHEFKGSNVRGIEHQDDVGHDFVKVIKVEKGKETSPSKHNIPAPSSTVSLLQNIKKIAAQSRGILENMTRQVDLNSDMLDSEDEGYIAPRPIQLQSPKHSKTSSAEGKCLNSPQLDVNDKGVISSQVKQSSGSQDTKNIPPQDLSGSFISETQNDQTCDNEDLKMLDRRKDLLTDDIQHIQDDVQNKEVNRSTSEFHPDSESIASVRKSDGRPVRLDLYVHSCSETLLLLLMENDSLKSQDLVLDLHKRSLAPLKDLDNQLTQAADVAASIQDDPLDYNYLTYNGYTKNLSGKISMARGTIQPLSHQELDFCATAIGLHSEFDKSPRHGDVTLRNHSTCVYGHKAGSQEMYFQPKQCKQPTGIPSVRDPTMCMDAKTCHSLLKDKGISIT